MTFNVKRPKTTKWHFRANAFGRCQCGSWLKCPMITGDMTRICLLLLFCLQRPNSHSNRKVVNGSFHSTLNDVTQNRLCWWYCCCSCCWFRSFHLFFLFRYTKQSNSTDSTCLNGWHLPFSKSKNEDKNRLLLSPYSLSWWSIFVFVSVSRFGWRKFKQIILIQIDQNDVVKQQNGFCSIVTTTEWRAKLQLIAFFLAISSYFFILFLRIFCALRIELTSLNSQHSFDFINFIQLVLRKWRSAWFSFWIVAFSFALALIRLFRIELLSQRNPMELCESVMRYFRFSFFLTRTHTKKEKLFAEKVLSQVFLFCSSQINSMCTQNRASGTNNFSILKAKLNYFSLVSRRLCHLLLSAISEEFKKNNV